VIKELELSQLLQGYLTIKLLPK